MKITCALLCTVHKSKFKVMYRSTEYLLPQSLYRISRPLVAKRIFIMAEEDLPLHE